MQTCCVYLYILFYCVGLNLPSTNFVSWIKIGIIFSWQNTQISWELTDVYAKSEKLSKILKQNCDKNKDKSIAKLNETGWAFASMHIRRQKKKYIWNFASLYLLRFFSYIIMTSLFAIFSGMYSFPSIKTLFSSYGVLLKTKICCIFFLFCHSIAKLSWYINKYVILVPRKKGFR